MWKRGGQDHKQKLDSSQMLDSRHFSVHPRSVDVVLDEGAESKLVEGHVRGIDEEFGIGYRMR